MLARAVIADVDELAERKHSRAWLAVGFFAEIMPVKILGVGINRARNGAVSACALSMVPVFRV